LKKTKPLTIFWIDDEKERKKQAEILEITLEKQKPNGGPTPNVVFLTLPKWSDFLEKGDYQEDSVDLFLVDYLLLVKGLHRGGGLSVSGGIREHFPEIPIYIFSAKDVPYIVKDLADHILTLKEVQRSPIPLYFGAFYYRLIRMSPRRSAQDLLKLLEAPEMDHKRIVLTLPENIKDSLSSRAKRPRFTTIEFARWVRQTLLKIPGFLFDSLYSATKLGITEEVFLEQSSTFKKARYDGVFAKTNPELWWNSKLREIVYETAIDKKLDCDTSDLRKLAPALFTLQSSKLSKCAVCGERYPETVGINKDDDEDYRPVHYKCSVPHPKRTRILYFEEPRQFSLEE